MSDDNPVFKCDLCSRIFNNRSSMYRHQGKIGCCLDYRSVKEMKRDYENMFEVALKEIAKYRERSKTLQIKVNELETQKNMVEK